MPANRTPNDLNAWLPAFVADALRPENISRWVDRTRESILQELPEVAAQSDLVEALSDAVRDQWFGFLSAFAQPDFNFRMVPAGGSLARSFARYSLPLEALIKVYGTAQQASWTYVTGVVEDLPENLNHTDILIYFWSRAAIWIDSSIGASIDIFHEERARRVAGAAAQRFELVASLLAGQPADPKRTSAALGGYPLSVHHTALILVAEDPSIVGDLDAVASEMARLLKGSRPLIVHPGGRHVWAWIGTRDVPDLAALDSCVCQLESLGATACVGVPAEGIAGFVTSHREADRVRALATDRTSPRRLVRYEDIALIALLGCSPEVDRYVSRVLGGLAAPGESTERLRETVEAFLQHGGNVEDAAQSVFVHRNTVRYRLGRAEEVLGRSIARVGDELLVAIRHHNLFHVQR